MSQVHDDVIRDLLPLYVDDICSPETRKIIELHLATSPELKQELDNLKTDLQIPSSSAYNNRQEGQAIKRIATVWNRSRWMSFIKGGAIATLSCAVIALAYVGLFRWNIASVPSDVIAISDVGKLADGKIVYHVRLTDGYESNQANYSYHEDGTIYITPKRPIIKSKAKHESAISRYDTIDMFDYYYKERFGQDKQFNTIYYGTPEDRVLVWDKDMKVPPASAKAEAGFVPE
ncbi:hypothetical protein GCM10010912_64650 [Paenibacillus albidus]|uniref:Putative zinc-finger domain-containing protein n=1 Tax=Paenibacillus albidus TaxID=2041023 RepID=A0A917D6E8_9BACL|nr:zf-HC2 domain-containing protein [Paenibacillus albidus]GGG11345.1 hypothetical protein GCM10010912_64650 [Paenibacillus albidus]